METEKVTGQAKPIARSEEEAFARALGQIVTSISQSVIESKRMDQSHEKELRLELYRRITTFAYVLLGIGLAVFFFGKEAITLKLIDSGGAIATTLLALVVGLFLGGRLRG